MNDKWVLNDKWMMIGMRLGGGVAVDPKRRITYNVPFIHSTPFGPCMCTPGLSRRSGVKILLYAAWLDIRSYTTVSVELVARCFHGLDESIDA